jgi:hypothetical protein
MKRFTVSIALLAVVASLAIVFGAGVAGADPGNGSGASVTRVNPNTCYLFLNGGLVPFACTYQRVSNPSGNIQYNVKGIIDASTFSTDQAFHFDNANQSPLVCAFDAPNYAGGVISPSGNVNFACQN